MKLTATDLQQLCQLAIAAARSAGEYIASTRPEKIEHKKHQGSLASQVVTEIDHQSQRRILQLLEPSLSQYDLGLLTEERPDDGSRLNKDYFWCVDPLDGTLSFIEGTAGYAVSIALVSRQGIPVIGVVFDPVEQALYHAVRGGGACKNSKPWQPNLLQANAPLTIYTDRSALTNPMYKQIAQTINATCKTYGGAVMNAIWCLENASACYFKLTKPNNGGGCLWDFAATSCLYHELGAWSSDVHGEPLNLNHAESVYLNHCGILFTTCSAVAQQFLQARKDLA